MAIAALAPLAFVPALAAPAQAAPLTPPEAAASTQQQVGVLSETEPAVSAAKRPTCKYRFRGLWKVTGGRKPGVGTAGKIECTGKVYSITQKFQFLRNGKVWKNSKLYVKYNTTSMGQSYAEICPPKWGKYQAKGWARVRYKEGGMSDYAGVSRTLTFYC
ncbi:hypothetical protein ACFVH6_05640 [Spirillospora sp. NPDC127200]